MRWCILILAVAGAVRAHAACDTKYESNCRVLFQGGINLPTNLSLCSELAPPTPPPIGKEYFYCKSGIGWCSMDATGAEHCAGGGATGGPPTGPTAPFPCTTAATGIYIDTSCGQWCVCNSGQGLWCRADTGVCGTSTDCCVAATTTTTVVVTTTTSTTLLGASADWSATMLAVWRLEEASGTRVNANGITAYNLTDPVGTATNDPVNFKEGAAANLLDGSAYLRSTNATLVGMVAPFTCVAWARYTGSGIANPSVIADVDTHTPGVRVGGFQLNYNGGPWVAAIFNGDNEYYAQSTGSTPLNTWAHVGIKYLAPTLTLYVNGAVAATTTPGVPYTPNTGQQLPFAVGAAPNPVGVGDWQGQIDEVACYPGAMLDADVCRICSCGVRGEFCSCTGTAWNVTGRNAASCGSCTLPATCNATAPATTTTTTTTTTTSTTTTTISTTTTTLANAAPNWTTSFTAVWLMEESSGTRTNAQGTTTRNLSEVGGTSASNTTYFQQGAASLQSAPATSLQSTDTALVNLGTASSIAWTCMAWARPQSTATGRLIQNAAGGTGGWYLDFITSNTSFQAGAGGTTTAPSYRIGSTSVTVGTWNHVGVANHNGTGQPCNIWLNGKLSQGSDTCAFNVPPGSQPFVIGGQGVNSFDGQLDEAACINAVLPDADLCRICSCGIDGARCSCTGTAWNVTGRNAASCGSCTLPASCTQATP